MTRKLSNKRRLALDAFDALWAKKNMGPLTVSDIHAMSDRKLYSFLEVWGGVWDGSDWNIDEALKDWPNLDRKEDEI